MPKPCPVTWCRLLALLALNLGGALSCAAESGSAGASSALPTDPLERVLLRLTQRLGAVVVPDGQGGQVLRIAARSTKRGSAGADSVKVPAQHEREDRRAQDKANHPQ